MLIIAICLAILGAVAGSFTSAVAWRLHEQRDGKKSKQLSIVSGRSMCPRCHHTLAWYDLVPVFSWLAQQGRCRYCKKPISPSYPALELLGALAFVASYVWWPTSLSQPEAKFVLTGWLLVFIGLLALAIYDLRWQILPNRLIYPTAFVAVLFKVGDLAFYDNQPGRSLWLWGGALVVSSGVFWVLYELSSGKWIGFGDVRLGIISGTVLATPPKSLLMIFLASVIGSLAVLPSILSGKRHLASKIPYGPFLIAATAICVLFGGGILNWYQRFLN